jgi:hypothetical protein
VIAAAQLDANRISGEKSILPDNNTQTEIGRSGVEQVVGAFKLCIGDNGTVTTVAPLRSTGFPAYDAKILDTIRGHWRYKPYLVAGKPTAVCTAVRFVYSQK